MSQMNKKENSPDEKFSPPTLAEEKEIIKRRRENSEPYNYELHDRGRYV